MLLTNRGACKFAPDLDLDYDAIRNQMTNNELLCDGCGQTATSEHIAKRLKRLEWTTRYRPVHIGTVLLGAFAPRQDSSFLYTIPGAGEFTAESKNVLTASGVSQHRKSPEVILAEFQRSGFLLTYVLECPLHPGVHEPAAIQALLRARVPALLARIRRSLRPKRIVPISDFLEPLLETLTDRELACSVVLDNGKPFAFDGAGADQVAARLSQVLAGAAATSH